MTLCNVEDITSLNVRREDELTEHVEIRLKDPDKEVGYREMKTFFLF